MLVRHGMGSKTKLIAVVNHLYTPLDRANNYTMQFLLLSGVAIIVTKILYNAGKKLQDRMDKMISK
jgi:hypothetical protein